MEWRGVDCAWGGHRDIQIRAQSPSHKAVEPEISGTQKAQPGKHMVWDRNQQTPDPETSAVTTAS
jgi:hypothetical protein